MNKIASKDQGQTLEPFHCLPLLARIIQENAVSFLNALPTRYTFHVRSLWISFMSILFLFLSVFRIFPTPFFFFNPIKQLKFNLHDFQKLKFPTSLLLSSFKTASIPPSSNRRTPLSLYIYTQPPPLFSPPKQNFERLKKHTTNSV